MIGDLKPLELFFATPSYEPELHPPLSCVGGKGLHNWKSRQALRISASGQGMASALWGELTDV